MSNNVLSIIDVVFESLNESSTTKYGLLSHTCTNQLFRTKIIFVTTKQRDMFR